MSVHLSVLSILTLLLVILISSCVAQEKPMTEKEVPALTTRSAVKLYSDYCASCHGADARAFADRKSWVQGDGYNDIKKVIKEGLPNEGMPEFASGMTEDELTSLTQYILDAKEQVGTYAFENEFNDSEIFSYGDYNYRLELISDQMDIPWGITQTPNGDIIYGDKSGDLIHIDRSGKHKVISGLPQIDDFGQGGLMDILVDPDYAKNQNIYISYSKPNPDNSEEFTTAVYKGKLENGILVNGEDIWIGLPYLSTKYHFGSRMIIDNDGRLYVTIGDRGKRDVNPQNLEVAPGKVHRINLDGSIPSDNPFVGNTSAVQSIYSYGHRNPQGLVYDSSNDIIYDNEHGPRGGDEINKIEAGNNYGWPIISYGINYSGTVFTEKTAEEGMEQPLHYWVPAIGVCGMTFVTSDKYPDWQNHILSGSLKYKYLSLTPLENGTITKEEKLFPNIGRLRTVIQGTDGYIYLGVEGPGRIYRILPQ